MNRKFKTEWFDKSQSEGPMSLKQVQRIVLKNPRLANNYHCNGVTFAQFQEAFDEIRDLPPKQE